AGSARSQSGTSRHRTGWRHREVPRNDRASQQADPAGQLGAFAQRDQRVRRAEPDPRRTHGRRHGHEVRMKGDAPMTEHLTASNPAARTWTGYLRSDGRKGIRNLILVIYTVECAQHVAHAIAAGEDEVQVLGFPGCYDNQYAVRLMLALGRHPNVGGVLAVGLGCEYTRPDKIADVVSRSERPAHWFYIQSVGGTQKSIEKGKQLVREMRERSQRDARRVEMSLADLTVGAECGGSDGTSGLAGNPV